MSLKYLESLWALADRVSEKRNQSFTSVFYPIGLFLHRPLEDGGYDSTPCNCESFARTGGDGVHYNLLEINGEISDDSPVVMTVPMMFDNPNIIVGENLSEFLCLGCEVGYFALEQLAYDIKQTIQSIMNPGPLDNDQAELLRLIREEFDLQPITQINYRFEVLQRTYIPLLTFSKRYKKPS